VVYSPNLPDTGDLIRQHGAQRALISGCVAPFVFDELNFARASCSAQHLGECIDDEIVIGLGEFEADFRVLPLHLGDHFVRKDVRVAGRIEPASGLEHRPPGIALLWIEGHGIHPRVCIRRLWLAWFPTLT